ncbi:MAG: transglycosylase SLT domain-containing protein [Pseudomonadota bacterium]
MLTVYRFLAILFLPLAALGAFSKADPLAGQREQFIEARKALQQKQYERFESLAAGLEDYPLYSYLEFDRLRQNLDQASEQEVLVFIERHAGQPLGKRLHTVWLYSLARQQRWAQLLKYYDGSSATTLQCYALRARINTGRKKGVVAPALALWTVGKSQPKACDPLFDWLYAGNHVKDTHVWQRIRLAMANGQTSLAKYLAKRLPEKDTAWVTLWRQAYRHPNDTLKNPRLDQNSAIARDIVLHAVKRIARSDADRAHDKWKSLKNGYSFTPLQRGKLERYIALSAAQQHRPAAFTLLEALPQDQQDARVRDWQLRAALAATDWDALLAHIQALPAGEQQHDEWRYWQARALEHTGERLQAINEYTWLAKERSYHGFLAADYLSWPYAMGDMPTGYDAAALAGMRQQPALLRAHELLRADMLTDARREWAYATRDMSKNELKLAAVLASQWGWDDRAILTVARTGEYADLAMRFPLEHADSVHRYARDNDLDPGVVFAVIRQESAFNPEARSPAGARGLMQLMPKTGRQTARRNRIPYSSATSLYDSDRNIRIGSSYLRQVMQRFGDNTVLAAAAYNAGPHRVLRWLPETGGMAASNWVANIPFSETRKYVQRILAYAAIYDWRMQRPVTKLEARMPDVYEESVYRESGG